MGYIDDLLNQAQGASPMISAPPPIQPGGPPMSLPPVQGPPLPPPGPPPPQMSIAPKRPQFVAPAPQVNPDDGTDGEPDLEKLQVTPEEQKAARDAKAWDIKMGGVGDALANRQSFGNFFLGHMNPKQDVSGTFNELAKTENQPVLDKQAMLKQVLAAPSQKYEMDMATGASAPAMMLKNFGTGILQKENSMIDPASKKALIAQLNDPKTTGYEAAQILDNPIFKEGLTANSAMAKIQAMAARGAFGGLSARVEETKNKNATQVGHDYDNDSIVKASKIKMNSMAQSGSILTNPDKPVLANDFAAAYQDYLAGTTPGGSPTEGKAHREMPDTFEQKWNSFKSKYGENDDMRKDATGRELIANLQKNIGVSVRELKQQVANQAESLHNNYLDSTNPRVLETNKRKLLQYAPETYNRIYGGGATAPSDVQGPIPAAPPAQSSPPTGTIHMKNPNTGQEFYVKPENVIKAKADKFEIVQ